ncbi:family 43 glycosylhydrolase [Aeoliella sp. ICT_H6.2]|uniref:Family 43 glycosylhydrolase n=1 Tax=Aeoliella straminimaris TaxID=2954799 RepID=A0A9X2FGZ6_9BACT|nr:family 43 glycosylhydrolase [Aeoliella straminimaris]MCO6045456.1 family 43 glycosylhydrolase [Aeoliella straminimaris]
MKILRSQLVPCFAIIVLQMGAACAQLTGELGAHDPSTVVYDNGRYYYFSTGDLLAARSSVDLVNWTREPSPFNQLPSWVPGAVPGYTGRSLWAPDVIKLDNEYKLYYSASVWGTKLSGMGLATSPTLDPDSPDYGWTDHGIVMGSGHSNPYNAIDPSMMLDDDTGKLWMTWGSFNNGIYVKEMDPTTGLPLDSSPGTNVAAPGPTPEIEGAAMMQRDGYYYLFTNWGGCCSGSSSTYNIRVGRSDSPTGPFLDAEGVNMLAGGGTLFMDDDGRKIGPGHFSFMEVDGQQQFSYHYYDADRPWAGGQTGFATFGLRDLHWTSDDWPSLVEVNPYWTGQSDRTWESATNWTYDTVPDGVGHVANFAAQTTGPYTVALSTSRTVGTINFRGFGSYTLGSLASPTLTIDDVAGETATLNVAEGSHTIAAPINAVDNLEANVTPSASALTLMGQVVAPRLSKYGDGNLVLSGANSNVSGNLFVRRGTLSVTGSLSASSYTSVGQILGETATMRVAGSGSFTANADFNIGDTGDNSTPATGTLYLSDNASIVVGTSGGFYVGSGYNSGSRAEGTVVQSGGTLTVNRPQDGSFVVGGRGSANANGVYNLSGGTVDANTNVFVGGRGTGTVNQSGGTFDASGFVAIGRYSGSTGSWTISDGTLNQANADNWLLVGEEGEGTLTVDGYGLVNAVGATQVGYQSSGAGVINLRGGTFRARSITRGAGTATVNFNGGVLQSRLSTSTLLENLTAANVQTGGAKIDTQAYDVTLSQSLLHDAALGTSPDGGLTKFGTGTLTLTTANTFTGATSVSEGTLRLTGAASIASSAIIEVHPGASFDVSELGSTFQLAAGQTLINQSDTTVVGDVTATSGSTVTGKGVFRHNVTIASGSRLAVGGATATTAPTLSVTNGDFETGINPPGDSDVDLWFDVDSYAGASDFWNTAQHEQGLSPTADAGVLLGDGNGDVGGPIGVGGRWIYQQIGAKSATSNYTVSLDYGGDNAAAADRAVSVRLEVYQGQFPGAADDVDIAGQGLALVASVDSPTTDLFGEGNFASFSTALDLSAANDTDPLWLRISNLPGAGSDPGSWVVIDNVTIDESFAAQGFETLTVEGDLSLESGSITAFDIAGDGVGDRLEVAGNLQIADGSVLELVLDSSVAPESLASGDVWNLLDFATATGTFDPADFILPTLSGNLVWDTSNLLVDGTIAIALPGLPGDFNSDGLVDLADYTVWRNHLGAPDSVLPTGSTTDGSGIVDGGDYLTWKQNFGAAAGTAPPTDQTNVPEPASLLLVLCGTAAALALHGRTSRR